MSTDSESQTGKARRTFLARLLAGMGAAALLSGPRRARAAKHRQTQAEGPILYRRSPETERYYRTLYR